MSVLLKFQAFDYYYPIIMVSKVTAAVNYKW